MGEWGKMEKKKPKKKTKEAGEEIKLEDGR